MTRWKYTDTTICRSESLALPRSQTSIYLGSARRSDVKLWKARYRSRGAGMTDHCRGCERGEEAHCVTQLACTVLASVHERNWNAVNCSGRRVPLASSLAELLHERESG
jgi:hypothetical protein